MASHSAANKLLVDKTLNAGECRVESENTLVEYSVSESLQQTIVALANKLLTASDGYPDDSIGESVLVDVPEDTGADDELDDCDDTEEAIQGDVQQPEASTSEALEPETQQSETQQPDADQPAEAEQPETENGSGLEQSTEQNTETDTEPDTNPDSTTEESDDDSEQPLA
jgi:flagellar assembly protein FliH